MKKINIIIIDDQVNLLEPLSDTLLDYGYNVTIVDNGFKGIEIIKTQFFDVALIDINMPGINGLETFRQIHKLSPGTMVIMMSGASVEDIMQQALSEGAIAVINKPFKMSNLLEYFDDIANKPTILVVDDRWEDRETLKDVLSTKYTVLTAKDGDEAINMIQRSNIKAVFLDVRMPGKDGIETLTAIKKCREDIAVIMMTGYEIDESVANSIKNDIYTILYKPFNLDKLFQILEEANLWEQTKPILSRALILANPGNNKTTLTNLLLEQNFVIAPVDSLAEAVKRLAEQFFPVVFIDPGVAPDVPVKELVKSVKKVQPQVYVILFVDWISSGTAQSLPKEVDDFVYKPVNPGELKLCLRRAQKSMELNDENKKLIIEKVRLQRIVDEKNTNSNP